MRWILWMVIFGTLLAGLFCGCVPQSVKQSAAMTGEILVKAQEVATAPVLPEEDLSLRLVAINGMLDDGLGLVQSIETYLGEPDNLVEYTPDNAVALATKAQNDALLRSTIRDTIKALIPSPVSKGFAWMESILALVAAYGGTKISVAGIQAARKKLNGKG